MLNAQLLYNPTIKVIWLQGIRGKNDAASVAQFAHECILEHFFSTCWNIGWGKSQVDTQDSVCNRGDNLLQRGSKVDYPQGPPTLRAYLLCDSIIFPHRTTCPKFKVHITSSAIANIIITLLWYYLSELRKRYIDY